MRQADTLIFNGLVLTMDDEGTVVDNGALAVADGKIIAVGAAQELNKWEARERFDARGKLIMPGLVNAHTHLPMSLFRGLADDLPLEQWLQEHMFPAEARFINADTVRLGTQLSAAEMLLSGTTTCCDGYFLANEVAAAIARTGLRAVSAQGVIDFPAPGVPDPAEKIRVAESFVQDWKDRSPLISPSIFCHSPYTCSSRTLQGAKAAANQLGVLFQIHVAETQVEAQQCQQAHGCSPVAYLARLGLLDRSTLLIHAVWVDESDMNTIARCQTPVIHCPESNMKLASGISPVAEMLSKGILVGLGTDGCASNNDLDLFGEMDSAAKLHKSHQLDPTVIDAGTVVRMATIQGARVLGLEQRIGSLEAGKQADLITIDLDQPHLTPMYRAESHLAYAVKGSDVMDVMIDGRWVVRNRKLLTLDTTAIIEEARALGCAIAGMETKRG